MQKDKVKRAVRSSSTGKISMEAKTGAVSKRANILFPTLRDLDPQQAVLARGFIYYLQDECQLQDWPTAAREKKM